MRSWRLILCASFFLAFWTTAHAVIPYFLYLKIYQHEPERLADRAIGFVPVNPGKSLPSTRGGLAYVRVLGDLSRFTVERLVEVLAQRQLTGIDLSAQSAFGDADCAALSHAAPLHYLNLSGTLVTDRGLAAFGEMPGLKVLALGDQFTKAALATVVRFHDLEILDLRATSISDDGLASLASLHSLRRLELGPAVTDTGLRALSPLHKLRHLDLSQTQMTDAGVSTLTAFSHLETFLAGRRLTSVGLMELAELPLRRSLKRLDLSNTEVSDRAIGTLALFENLEELALSGTTTGDIAIRRLSRLPHLRALELSDTLMTGEGLEALSALVNLEVLSISLSEHLSVADLRSLRQMRKLHLLIVNGRAIVGPSLSQLMTKLNKLDQSPKPSSGAQENSADVIAQGGPLVPVAGLPRLNISPEDSTALPTDSGFNQAQSS